MKRRGFIKSSSLTGIGLFPGFTSIAQEKSQAAKPFNLSYAFHDGMFSNHAGKDFIDQIKFAHDQGFNAIEDNGMMSRTPEMQSKIGDTLAKLGMRMGVFVKIGRAHV